MDLEDAREVMLHVRNEITEVVSARVGLHNQKAAMLGKFPTSMLGKYTHGQ